jgi:hypothetical protein
MAMMTSLPIDAFTRQCIPRSTMRPSSGGPGAGSGCVPDDLARGVDGRLPQIQPGGGLAAGGGALEPDHRVVGILLGAPDAGGPWTGVGPSPLLGIPVGGAVAASFIGHWASIVGHCSHVTPSRPRRRCRPGGSRSGARARRTARGPEHGATVHPGNAMRLRLEGPYGAVGSPAYRFIGVSAADARCFCYEGKKMRRARGAAPRQYRQLPTLAGHRSRNAAAFAEPLRAPPCRLCSAGSKGDCASRLRAGRAVTCSRRRW